MKPDRVLTQISRRRRRSRFTSFLAVLYLPALGLGLGGLLWLFLSVQDDIARIRAASRANVAAQIAQCRVQNAQRLESNEHLRTPLKAAITEAAGGTPKQRAAELATSRREEAQFSRLAKTDHDPAVRTLFLILSHALEENPKTIAAYASLARQIEPVPLLDCGSLKGDT